MEIIKRKRSKNAKDHTGKRFGKLTAIKDIGAAPKDQGRIWECVCDCGNTTAVTTGNLRHVKSCGCLRGNHNKLPEGESDLNQWYTVYYRMAKQRGLDFKLSKKQFKEIVQKPCYYCGTKPVKTKPLKGLNGSRAKHGIDRVDNDKGYVKRNCVSCCKMCNRLKQAHTKDKFLHQIRKIYENLQLGEL